RRGRLPARGPAATMRAGSDAAASRRGRSRPHRRLSRKPANGEDSSLLLITVLHQYWNKKCIGRISAELPNVDAGKASEDTKMRHAMSRRVASLAFVMLSTVALSAISPSRMTFGQMADDKLGEVHFPISCATVQSKFDRAVALLHNFFFPET